MLSISINQKNQHDCKNANGTRQVSLVNKDDLRPYPPQFATIGIAGRKKILQADDGMPGLNEGFLRTEKGNHTKCPVKEEEGGANAPHGA